MHDEREQAELIKRQRDANKAYSASNELGDETESQVGAVYRALDELAHDTPAVDYNEPPPLSPSDRVWGQRLLGRLHLWRGHAAVRGRDGVAGGEGD